MGLRAVSAEQQMDVWRASPSPESPPGPLPSLENPEIDLIIYTHVVPYFPLHSPENP